MDTNKRVGVLFSGGLDSTYLIWKNLKEGNEVVPFYFEIENNKDKTALEKNRIELLRRAFNLEYPDKVKPIEYTVKVEVNTSANGVHLPQLPVWILGIVYSQHEEISEFQIGYVMNDDAISYLSEIQKLYKSYNLVTEPLIPLKFPITKVMKWQIWEELPKDYHDFIVSCEAPRNIKTVQEGDMEVIRYEPCGQCGPCGKILSTNNFHCGPTQIYEKPLFNKALNIVQQKKDLERKEVDGRYYYMVEIEDCELKAEPYQLPIPFDGEMECEKEVEYEEMLKEAYEKE